MSRATSPSGGGPSGLALVCRVWGVARSTVYRHREPPRAAAPRRPGPAGPMPDAELLVLQLRLHGRELPAPVVGPGDGLVPPAPERPSQDERRRWWAAAEREARDQAADLGDAERHEELASGSGAPFILFRPARSPASRASASMASVTCRCQPRQLLTS